MAWRSWDQWGQQDDSTTTTFNTTRVQFAINTSAGTACTGGTWDAPQFQANDWGQQQTDIQTTTANTTTGTDTTLWTTQDLQSTWGGTVALGEWAFSEGGKLKNALMKIFEKVPKELIKTAEDRKLVKAKEKSEKLLKEWMTTAEYKALTEKGEIELPSKFEEDVIFIIKKDPNQMVDVRKKGQYSHKLCAVAEDFDYPVGDQLLSKIALLKTNERQFKEVAIKH